jgi:hypothetical protein
MKKTRIQTFYDWLENASLSKKYWGPYSLVTIEGEYIKIAADDLGDLYVQIQNNVTNIGNGPINQRLNPPWVKYFEYTQQGDKNIITYAENRAVDCVPYSRSNNAVYLINRKLLGVNKPFSREVSWYVSQTVISIQLHPTLAGCRLDILKPNLTLP